MAFWNRFFGGAGSTAAGIAIGATAVPAMEPIARSVVNDTWALHPSMPVDADTAAAIVAEDVEQIDWGRTEASHQGINQPNFDAMYREKLSAPGVGELLALLRRNSEVQIDFAHGLRKAKLEQQWDDALRNLRDLRIPGPDLAYMVVRGVVPDGGTLPSSLPTRADNLSLPPQLGLDTLLEASKTGWDAERFAALVARSGLAMAPVMAAQANFRGILTDNDYLLTIARGDLFPAYADPVREVARQILSSTEYTERQLRGYTDRAGRLADTRKHGMSDEDSDKLFQVLGRPLAVHQITTGLARGGAFNPQPGELTDPYEASVHESNIKPAYYDLAIANKYSYPTGFMIRAEAQANRLTLAETEQILLEIGWSPKWSTHFATSWTGGTTAASDPHVTKAENQLWTTLHRSYVAAETDDPTATATLGTLGVTGTAQPQVLALWQAERELIRKQLTPAQVKKAYSEGVENPATGATWTRDDALAALIARGYSANDANTFLDL
jgi:hypothetical protein